MRGDHGAGLVEIAELERDGGADDRFLPVDRDRQAAHPFHPVVVRALGEFAAGRRQIALERLVRPEHEVHRPGEHEGRLALDQRERRVRRQADHGGLGGIADMVAAKRVVRERLAVVARGPHPDGDPRQAGDRLDDPIELRRPEYAAELAEARHEVGDLDLAAVRGRSARSTRSPCCACIPTETPPCRRARRRRIPSPACPPAIGRRSGRRRNADSTTTRSAPSDRPMRPCARSR